MFSDKLSRIVISGNTLILVILIYMKPNKHSVIITFFIAILLVIFTYTAEVVNYFLHYNYFRANEQVDKDCPKIMKLTKFRMSVFFVTILIFVGYIYQYYYFPSYI
ncbi:MAG: hypothetical protein GY756_12135 [bacterium]|nr:hypothetical protein [bacterium]